MKLEDLVKVMEARLEEAKRDRDSYTNQQVDDFYLGRTAGEINTLRDLLILCGQKVDV